MYKRDLASLSVQSTQSSDTNLSKDVTPSTFFLLVRQIPIALSMTGMRAKPSESVNSLCPPKARAVAAMGENNQ
jgi:hypothetical protein